jgi:hypothetical protein
MRWGADCPSAAGSTASGSANIVRPGPGIGAACVGVCVRPVGRLGWLDKCPTDKEGG